MITIQQLQQIATEISKHPVLAEIDALKKELDAKRPLDKEVEERVMQKFKLEWNYHSNAIEGNPYSYGETVTFILYGITAKGKTLKDHLDIKGHHESVNFLLSLVKDERGISEADIRSLHKMLLVEPYYNPAIDSLGNSVERLIEIGKYKMMSNSVRTSTGEMHYYPEPNEVPALMTELMDWYQSNRNSKEVHPFVLAALFHHRFVAIHPFDDGNGRMTRLLMNFILLQKNYPPIIVKQQDRNNYYGVLNEANDNKFLPLFEYFADLLNHSLNIYLKAANGESIDEPSDIDKEIALLKKELEREDIIKERKNLDTIKFVISSSIFPLFEELQKHLKKFDELFFESYDKIHFGKDDYSGLFGLETKRWDLIKVNFLSNSVNLMGINSFNYIFEWKGLKKSKNGFDLKFELLFQFEEYKFILNKDKLNRTKFEKYYHEKFSESDIQLVIKESVGEIIKDIKRLSELS